MQKSESITNITAAIVAVMKEVKGIEKNMTVGAGNNSYKGVSDKDVKNEIGKAMEKHGLCLIPTEVMPKLQIDRWEETGGQYGPKQKQSVFTEVQTKYLLLHTSGEWVELSGYGHGTDTQDKAAGKATTYALKYTLLYTFMVPTGTIDDTDAKHSDETAVPARISINEAKKRAEEIKTAIKDLLDCKSVDHLKSLKGQLPDFVIKNESFVDAARQRYNELTEAAKQMEEAVA